MTKEKRQFLTDEEFDASLTQEEVDAADFLDWSDETLGRLTRHVAAKIEGASMSEWGRPAAMSAVYILMGIVHASNAGELSVDIEGGASGGENIGDWEIIVRRKS